MTEVDSGTRFSVLHGSASLSPGEPVVAGSMGTWRVRYRVGKYGIDDGGRIRVARRFVSDWGTPQTERPGQADFLTVSTSGSARVTVSCDPQAHVRPWQKSMTVSVKDGYLREGDTVTLVLGDTSAGGPGARAQTFCEPRFEFKVLVDCFGTGSFVELEPAGSFSVVGGPAAELQLMVPTDVVLGIPFRVSVRVLDQWGNPADRYQGVLDTGGSAKLFYSLPSRLTLERADQGILCLDGILAREPGIYRIEAEDQKTGLRAVSNPLFVKPHQPRRRRFWGDLHGQSEETVGTLTVGEYFSFARNKALVDFAGHQGNCFQITPGVWDRIRETVRRFNEPGRFVTFLGYEWSGLTAGGGDRNVYFRGGDGPLYRASRCLIAPAGRDEDPECYPVEELYRQLGARDDVLLVPHVGGRWADLDSFDPDLEPLVEIYSSWGEFEWLLNDAFDRGLRVGISCGSDDHKGRPGASYPGAGTFGVQGGLLCVWASELTRESLWEALRERRCYGTTGARIALEFETSGGVPMGGEERAQGLPRFRVRVEGTSDVERIELRRGTECVDALPRSPGIPCSSDTVRIAWSGARNRGRGRAACWDGSVEAVGTRIVEAKDYAFDSPSEGIREVGPQRVTWESVTSGDADGILLKLDPADSGVLRFKTGRIRFDIGLEKLADIPVTWPAGGLDLKVQAQREPLGLGRSVEADLKDPAAPAGPTPYHVVVLQKDGAKAWASPIWVSPGP
ncbi:MAG: DUF3604 domain-containing protein [Candidatus Aminicenantes bacterium]|nr:DUF3604 domain-containing protein [Candidatus Aminicenantes bacterium]